MTICLVDDDDHQREMVCDLISALVRLRWCWDGRL